MEEMTAYVTAWQLGESWASGPDPIPDEYVKRAIHIWRNGETYRQIPGVAAPMGWVPDPDGETHVALEHLQGEPLDFIEVQGLPANTQDVEASFRAVGFPGEFPAYLADTFDGRTVVVVPVNPYEPLGGGEVMFQFADGPETWKAGPVELLELPPAPGELALLRETISDWVRDFAALGGVDDIGSHLAAPLSEVPQEILPLVLLLHEFEGPLIENNLAALLDGTAPVWAGEPEEPDFMERLAAKAGFRGRLPDLQGLEPEPAVAGSAEPKPAAVGSPEPAGFIEAMRVEINDGRDLSKYMRLQAEVEARLAHFDRVHNAVDEVEKALSELMLDLDDVFNAAKTVYGDVETDPWLGDDPTRAEQRVASGTRMTNLFGVAFSAVEYVERFFLGTNPDHFLALEVEFPDNEERYAAEDDCSRQLMTALATVASRGIEFSAERRAEVPIPGTSSTIALPDILPHVELDLGIGVIAVEGASVTFDATVMPELFWNGIELNMPTLNGDEIFVSVDIDPEVLETVVTRGPGGLKITGWDLRPIDVGEAAVLLQAKPELFGGRSISGLTEFEVRPLRPVITEYPHRVDPGEIIEDIAGELWTAKNRELEDVEWEIETATGRIITDHSTPIKWGEEFVLPDLVTPSEAFEYPLVVRMHAVTEACVREREDAPPRYDSAIIHAKGFVIGPRIACLAEGDSQTFSVAWPGGKPDEVEAVEWSVVSGGGTIQSTGPFEALYIAPANAAPVILRAENSDDPSDFATVQFEVNCKIEVNFHADSETSFPPDEGEWNSEAIFLTRLSDDFIPVWQIFGHAHTIVHDSVTPVAEHPGYFSVEGSVAGYGVVLTGFGMFTEIPTEPGQDVEFLDNSENDKEYTVQTPDGETSYELNVGLNPYPLDEERVHPGLGVMNIVDMVGDHTVKVSFGGDGGYRNLNSFDEPDPEVEIEGLHWLASSGDTATGETAVLEFPAEPGMHWVRLQGTDNYGNIASVIVEFRMVSIGGGFTYDFHLSGSSHTCWSFDNQFVPGPAGACGIELDLAGPLQGTFKTGSGGVETRIYEEVPGWEPFEVKFRP